MPCNDGAADLLPLRRSAIACHETKVHRRLAVVSDEAVVNEVSIVVKSTHAPVEADVQVGADVQHARYTPVRSASEEVLTARHGKERRR